MPGMQTKVPHPKKIYKVIRHFYREFVRVFFLPSLISLLPLLLLLLRNFFYFLLVCSRFFFLFSLQPHSSFSSSLFVSISHSGDFFSVEDWPFSILLAVQPHSGIFILRYHFTSTWATSFVAFCSFRFFENNILERKRPSSIQYTTLTHKNKERKMPEKKTQQIWSNIFQAVAF